MLVNSFVALLSVAGSSLVLANPEPRPPGPRQPPDYTKLSSMSLTPKEALDVNAMSVDQVVSSLLGPHDEPIRYDPNTSKQGTIKMTASNLQAWLGDGSLDGDAVWAPVFDQSSASKFRVPSNTCMDLPPLFSVEGVLSPYGPIPFVGVSTFIGSPGAETTIGANSGGYGFVVPVNMTNPKTYAMSLSSLGKPYGAESAIWSMNCITRELKATWTSQDGSQVPLTFVAWSEDGLIVTGNYELFKKSFPDTGLPLTLTFVPANSGSKVWFYPPHKQAAALIKSQNAVNPPAAAAQTPPVKVVAPAPAPANNKPATTPAVKPAATTPQKQQIAPAAASVVASPAASVVSKVASKAQSVAKAAQSKMVRRFRH